MQNKVSSIVYSPQNISCEYIATQSFGESGLTEIEVFEGLWKTLLADNRSHVAVVYLLSPPGLGKTTLAYYLAEKFDAVLGVIDCRAGLIDLDLLGTLTLDKSSTKWMDGPIPTIIRATNKKKRGILLVNEINVLSPATQLVFQSLMDRQEGVRLIQNNDEFVQVAPDAHLLIIATMNPDVLGINELQEAVRDRALTMLRFEYPSEKREAEIVASYLGLDPSFFDFKKYPHVRLLFSLFSVIREKGADASSGLVYIPSVRATIDFIRLFVFGQFSLRDAFYLSVVLKYTIDQKEIALLNTLFDAKFGDDEEALSIKALNKWAADVRKSYHV